MDNIRNFCIIAHVDQGRALLLTVFWKSLEPLKRLMKAQYLDQLDLERERGMIKMAPVKMNYT